MAKISASVNDIDPIGTALNAIAETTCQLLKCDFGAVLLPDEAGERLLIRGSYGLLSSYVAMVDSRKPVRLGHGAYGEGPSSRAFRNQQIAVIRDYLKDPAAGPWAGVAVEQGYRTSVQETGSGSSALSLRPQLAGAGPLFPQIDLDPGPDMMLCGICVRRTFL